MAATAAKTWTYADLFELPDDGRRYEIIEGVLHEMAGPTFDHATAIMNLIGLLSPVVKAISGWIRTAPLDVFFEGADPVQPDLLVVLPGGRATGVPRGVEGVPDLLIEVLSPSNPAHDRVTKRALYARAGVREYWLVDSGTGSVEVLRLVEGAYRTHIRAVADEIVTSPLLPGLAFPASAVFAV